MDAQELPDPDKVSIIQAKNVEIIVNKAKNTKSSMTGMKPKDVIKIDTVKQNKTHPEKMVLPKDDIYINLLSSLQTKKYGLQTLSGVKIHMTGSNSKGAR